MSRDISQTGATETLADFACSLTWASVPDEVQRLTKATLLDSIGLALLGRESAPCRAVTEYFGTTGGSRDARIWGTELRVPAPHAAWVLSSRMCAFALDPVQSRLHAAAVVAGAAFATADRTRPSGERFLAALTAGMEGMIRIGIGVNSTEHYLKGWRPTTTCGPFGAAMVAGAISGLDTARMIGAFGVAGDQAGGLFTALSEGSASLVLGPGRAAFSGVLAAEFAERGILGSASILEAGFGGFFTTMATDYDLESVTEGLGERYRMLGLQTKPFPIPASLTTAVECAIELRSEIGSRASGVSKVVLHTNRAVANQCGGRWELSDSSEVLGQRAQLSAPYILAAALTDGTFDIRHITDMATMLRPDVIALSRRVTVVVDQELDDHYPRVAANRVEVDLRDGSRLAKTIGWPYGSEKRPADRSYLLERFAAHLGLAGFDRAHADRIVKVIDHLEELDDVSELFDAIDGEGNR